jgi:DNA-binding NarL/FixJ family response regulator
MDKRAPTCKEPRHLIVLAAVEVPADIELALRSDASGCIQQLLRSEAIANAFGLVPARRRQLPSLFLSSSAHDCGCVRARLQEAQEEQRWHVERRLSPRHREVVGLIAQGLSNKLIARQLGLAEGTVRSHLVQIFQILGVHNRTAAVMAAQESLASAKLHLVAEGHTKFGNGNPELHDATVIRRSSGSRRSSPVCRVTLRPRSSLKAKS